MDTHMSEQENNTYNFKDGDFALLDGKRKIKIISITKDGLLSNIQLNLQGFWEVSTSRLKPIK